MAAGVGTPTEEGGGCDERSSKHGTTVASGLLTQAKVLAAGQRVVARLSVFEQECDDLGRFVGPSGQARFGLMDWCRNLR